MKNLNMKDKHINYLVGILASLFTVCAIYGLSKLTGLDYGFINSVIVNIIIILSVANYLEKNP